MTEQDWLDLPSIEELCGELEIVLQPRKLFLLGSAFLRRVENLLPTEAERLAVETTERYARGQTSLRDLLETWTSAEAATAEDIWLDEHTARLLARECPCCYPDLRQEEAQPIHPCVREAVRDPTWFAARVAWYARDLVQEDLPTKAKTRAREAETRAQYRLYRDIVGDPCEPSRPAPAWATDPMVQHLATGLDRGSELDVSHLFVLADAMEEAGCTEGPLLDHFRQHEYHSRNCWVVELLLGRSGLILQLEEKPSRPTCRRSNR